MNEDCSRRDLVNNRAALPPLLWVLPIRIILVTGYFADMTSASNVSVKDSRTSESSSMTRMRKCSGTAAEGSAGVSATVTASGNGVNDLR
jgi:hypothetical protein